MRERAWRGFSMVCALWLGANMGCDNGSRSNLTNMGGAPAATGGSGGTPPATTCTQSSECTDQVCAADGRCVDCVADMDCLANQHCDAERCIANGGDMGGSTGTGTAGSGGGSSGGGTACNGAQVVFVVQRSGAMFEQPEGDTKYWSMVQSAVAADDGALAPYAGKLGVGALFFVRLQYEEEMACPVVSSQTPSSADLLPLREAFTTNAAAYQSLADDDAKMDAPVPEAIAAAAALLTGTTKHLVLISTGVPDTCTTADTDCAVDPTIKALQDASQQGVTTHVIGLGDTDSLDEGEDDDGYGTFLTQLANAGAGRPVKISAAFDAGCDDAKATYGESNGDAQAYKAASAADVKSAVTAILQKLCP